MKRLKPETQFTERDVGEWTNAGLDGSCRVWLPPLNPPVAESYTIVLVGGQPITISSIEADAILCNGQNLTNVDVPESPGGSVQIRNIMGTLWHVQLFLVDVPPVEDD